MQQIWLGVFCFVSKSREFSYWREQGMEYVGGEKEEGKFC